VDAVQYAIRLLVPPGSAILQEPDAAAWLGPLDEAAFTYRWKHPDSRMDQLYVEVSALVEAAAREQRTTHETFAAVRTSAEHVLGMRGRVPVGVPTQAGSRRAGRPVPHLSEPWFC